ncbi:hypothetical protein K461DRAFT_278743 [Myriangium duriaei CBS 260.36]|uniref:18S rRNA factor 2 n=1 Tax=Myriangium duriaei CBS 260.36 TaxID=1168546 RepID=A0A9P4IZ24_9PEZI|nr:hypothetical protein K461DRAFT_278743 [Myriangium duriaei CBS 260.36]
MSARKRNQWLEADDEDEDFYSADEGADEERSKTQLKSRSIKRRRIDDDLSDGSDDAFSDDEDFDKSRSLGVRITEQFFTPNAKLNSPGFKDDRFAQFQHGIQDEDEADDYEHTQSPLGLSKPILPQEDHSEPAISQSQLKAKAKAKKKSGVIYISRIPPFMKPQTLRTYLSPYGEIGKLFLTPEDAATYQRRKRSGGNKKHSYVDGWVEFLSKKDAKTVAETLNGNIMGGKKGNYYHDDIWNLKYLKGFKWDDLTEQIARENKEREARLRAEITKAKRENEGFVRDIERGKMLDTMESKKKGRSGRDGDSSEGATGKVLVRSGDISERPARQFKQKSAKAKRKDQDLPSQQQQASANVLSKM